MTDRISCSFKGGPQGTESFEMQGRQCLDTILLDISWIKPGPNNTVTLIEGQRPRNVEWVSTTRAVYKKIGKVKDGQLNYAFDSLKEFIRCSFMLPKNNRQCRHEAKTGSKLCNTHNQT